MRTARHVRRIDRTPGKPTRRRRGPRAPRATIRALVAAHNATGRLALAVLRAAWRSLIRQARRGVAAALAPFALAPFVDQVAPPPVALRAEWELEMAAATSAAGDVTTDAVGRAVARVIGDLVMGAFTSMVRWFARGVGAHFYVWTDSSDRKVRPLHRELNGTRHSWDNPPVSGSLGWRGHPGEPAGCRCVPTPTL